MSLVRHDRGALTTMVMVGRERVLPYTWVRPGDQDPSPPSTADHLLTESSLTIISEGGFALTIEG